MALVECVPNVSEGRDQEVIDRIAAAADSVSGASCLHVDSDPDAHRTVFTLAGEPPAMEEAVLALAEASFAHVDMRRHQGVHPRIGALDVVPFVPLHGVRHRECVALARRVAKELGQRVPVFLYGDCARSTQRANLAWLRTGGYEGLEQRLRQAHRAPDFGPGKWEEDQQRWGGTAVGVRSLLVAYNVDLSTQDPSVARDIALSVRERGRWMRDSRGRIRRDALGRRQRVRGRLRGVRAIGWFLETRGCAQVSMNLVDLASCSVVDALEAVREEAHHRGVEVMGSELVGLIPKRELLEAGLRSPQGQDLQGEELLLAAGVESLGLAKDGDFSVKERVLEFRLGARLPGYQSV